MDGWMDEWMIGCVLIGNGKDRGQKSVILRAVPR